MCMFYTALMPTQSAFRPIVRQVLLIMGVWVEHEHCGSGIPRRQSNTYLERQLDKKPGYSALTQLVLHHLHIRKHGPVCVPFDHVVNQSSPAIRLHVPQGYPSVGRATFDRPAETCYVLWQDPFAQECRSINLCAKIALLISVVIQNRPV